VVFSIGYCQSSDTVVFSIGSCQSSDSLVFSIGSCQSSDSWVFSIGSCNSSDSVVFSIGSCQSSDTVVFSIGSCQSSDTVVFSIGYCPPTVWYFGFLISLIIHNNIENIKLDGKIYSFYSVHAVMGFVISHLAGPTMPVQLPFSRNNYVCLC
jgi:hypothetical protein